MPEQGPHHVEYPEHADRFYAVVGGRSDVRVIAENPHAIAFEDGSDGEITKVAIISRDPIRSIASMDFSDALRWVGILDVIRAVPDRLGWGTGEGFRLDIPVHPPYQRQPWLCVHLTRNAGKRPKHPIDDEGYTRDIGHFEEIAALRKRVEVIYANDEFMIFDDLEDADHNDYDVVLVGITRRLVKTILDPEFSAQDWLSLVSGLREAGTRLGLDAYTTYLNVQPPYQHTPWVHAHLLAGGKALTPAHHRDSDHESAVDS